MMNQLGSVELALVDCLRLTADPIPSHHLETLHLQEWSLLVDLAMAQHVAPLVFHCLKQAGFQSRVPDPQWRRLQAAHSNNAKKNLIVMAQTLKIAGLLQDNHISVIILKGNHLANTVYGNRAMRVMGDLDILVPGHQASHAAELVRAMGYQPLKGYIGKPEDTLCQSCHLCRMQKKGWIDLEIHVTIALPTMQTNFSVDDLWRRAVPQQMGQRMVLVLSTEDLLLHLCEHTSLHHCFDFGLRPFCDLVQVIAHHGSSINWSAICERAIFWGWEKGVCLALEIAHDLLGAAVPAWVLRTLQPDPVDITILRVAVTQLLCNQQSLPPMSANMAQLWDEKTLWGKLRRFWQTVFLPDNIMATKYPIHSFPGVRYMYYGVRAIDVLRRYWQTAYGLFRSDADLTSLSARQNMLACWLQPEKVTVQNVEYIKRTMNYE